LYKSVKVSQIRFFIASTSDGLIFVHFL